MNIDMDVELIRKIKRLLLLFAMDNDTVGTILR